jgi:hypothetical protein
MATIAALGFLGTLILMLIGPIVLICFFVLVHRVCMIARILSLTRYEATGKADA